MTKLKPMQCEYRAGPMKCCEPATTTTTTITLDTRTVVRHLCQRHAGTTGDSNEQ